MARYWLMVIGRDSSSRSRSVSESEWYPQRSRAQSPPENHRMPVQWNNLYSNPPGARPGPSDQRARGGQDGASRARDFSRDRSPDSPPPTRSQSLFSKARAEEKPAEAGGLLVQQAPGRQNGANRSRSLSRSRSPPSPPSPPPPRSPSPFATAQAEEKPADAGEPATPAWRRQDRNGSPDSRPSGQRAQQIDWAPPARQEEGGNRWERRQSEGHWNSSRRQDNGERNGERRHHSRQESSRASHRSGDRGRHHHSRNGEGRSSRRQSSPPAIPANPIDRENERLPNRGEETQEHDRTQRRWPRDMYKKVKSEAPEVSERSISPTPTRGSRQINSNGSSGSRIVGVVELDDDEQQVTIQVASHLPTVPLVSDDTGPPGPAALPTPSQPVTHTNIQMDAATEHRLREVLAPFFPELAQASPSFMDPRQGNVGNHQFPPPVPSPYMGSGPGTSSHVAAAPAPYVPSQPGTVAVPQHLPPTPSPCVTAAPGTVAIPQFPSNQFSFPPPPLGTVPVQQFPHHQMPFQPPATPQYQPLQPYFQPYHVAPEVEAQQRARMEDQLRWQRDFLARSQAEERRSREIGLEKLRIANEKEVQRLKKDREDFEMKKAEEEALRKIARMEDEFQLQMELRGLETIRRIQEKEAERDLAARRSQHILGPSSQAQRMALEYQEMAAERDQWSDEEIPDTNFQSTSAGPPLRRYRPPTPIPRDEMGRYAAEEVVFIGDGDEVAPDPNIPSTSTASPRGHWRVRGEDGKFLKPGSSHQTEANRPGPQRRSMAQASGPSSDVQGASRPSRTSTAAASATPTTSSLIPSDPRRSTRLSSVAAGASIPATDTPTFSSFAPSDPCLSSRSTYVAPGAATLATAPIPASDTPSTSGLRRSGRASAGIPGWRRQPSEETEAAPSTSTSATRSTRKRVSEIGTSSSKKSKKDFVSDVRTPLPPHHESARLLRSRKNGGDHQEKSQRGLDHQTEALQEASSPAVPLPETARQLHRQNQDPVTSPFTPEAIEKEKALEARGQAGFGGAARSDPREQGDRPVVPRDPSQQRSERGQQGGGGREDFSRRNNSYDNNRRQNTYQAEQSVARRQESRYGGGSGPRDQDPRNRTSQPWRQNGGERLGGSGHKERELYRPPTQRGEQAAVTSSGQRDRRGSPARPQSGLRGRGHSSIHSDHPLRQDVKPESPEEIPTRTVPATSRRQIAAQPSRGSRVIDVIELGDDDEVPVAAHISTAPPVVIPPPAPPRAVPSSGQGMVQPYRQMDEATMDQFRGFLLQMFPPASAPHVASQPGTVAVPQLPPPAQSSYVASQPGTVAVPQFPPPAPSTHVAAAPGTVAIPEFQMSYPPPPLGTVPVQQFPQHQMAYPQPTTPQFPQPQPYYQPYHVAPEVEAQQRARMADQFRWEQEYFARRQGEERRLRELQLEQLRIAREHEEDRLMRAQEELERKKRREEQDRELTRIEEELALQRRRREVEVRRWRAQEEERAAEHPEHRAEPAVRYPAEPAARYPAEPAARYPAEPAAEHPALEEEDIVVLSDDEEIPRVRSPRVYLSDSEDEVELRMPEERRREQNERRRRRMPEYDAATPSQTPRERAMDQFHMDYEEQPNVPSTSDRVPRRRYRTPTPAPQEDEMATSSAYHLLRSATFHDESAKLLLTSAGGQAEQEAAAQVVDIEDSDEDEAPDPNVPSTSTAPPRGRGRRRGRGRGRGKSPTPPLTGEWVRGKDGVFRLEDIDSGSLPEKRQFVADYEYRTSRLLPRHQAFAEVEADRQRRDPNAIPIDVAALARSNAPLPVRAPGSPARPAPGQSPPRALAQSPSRVPAAQSPTAPGGSTSATTSTSTSSSSRPARSTRASSGAAQATMGSTPGAPVAAPVTPTTVTPSNSRPARSTRASSGAAQAAVGPTPGTPVAAPVPPTSALSGSRTTRLSAGSSSTPVLRRSTRATAGQSGQLADPESSDESDAAPSTSTPVRRSARKRASNVGSNSSKKSKKDLTTVI
ncbi:hypothetical protein CAEBREN_01207 [Caenorhabditis brenneri]|uniref:Uncharacterized protein n=1 Tax=Caenorhabditis brenneri TaxID=135651 RepID=G0MCM2_CAEBE|nr:hypothetical protein CAEBREN_01207 [Caenorhabditis brenneri]